MRHRREARRVFSRVRKHQQPRKRSGLHRMVRGLVSHGYDRDEEVRTNHAASMINPRANRTKLAKFAARATPSNGIAVRVSGPMSNAGASATQRNAAAPAKTAIEACLIFRSSKKTQATSITMWASNETTRLLITRSQSNETQEWSPREAVQHRREARRVFLRERKVARVAGGEGWMSSEAKTRSGRKRSGLHRLVRPWWNAGKLLLNESRARNIPRPLESHRPAVRI